MNTKALEKFADGNKSTATPNGITTKDWAPWAGALGSAILAHTIQKPDDDEEETTWDKIRRWLVTLGAGAGGYYLGDSVIKQMDPKYRLAKAKAKQNVKKTETSADLATAGKWVSHGLGGISHAWGLKEIVEALAKNKASPSMKALPMAGVKFPGKLTRFAKGPGKWFGLGAIGNAVGHSLGRLADNLELEALENQIKLENM